MSLLSRIFMVGFGVVLAGLATVGPFYLEALNAGETLILGFAGGTLIAWGIEK